MRRRPFTNMVCVCVNVNVRLCDFYHTNRFGSKTPGAPGHNTGLKRQGDTRAQSRKTLRRISQPSQPTQEPTNAHPHDRATTKVPERICRYVIGRSV
jgi:hypothetical protein